MECRFCFRGLPWARREACAAWHWAAAALKEAQMDLVRAQGGSATQLSGGVPLWPLASAAWSTLLATGHHSPPPWLRSNWLQARGQTSKLEQATG